jgi:hypothetical protein
MVGNDVVDLRDDEALAEVAARFDARVFCPEELASLDASPRRAHRRWQLWAAKEAAYKAAVKREPGTVFSPARFRVQLPADGAIGVVDTPPGTLSVRIVEADGAVHAIASHLDGDGAGPSGKPRRVVTGVRRLEAGDPAVGRDLGEVARRFACERLAPAFGVAPGSLEIRKRGRVPELWLAGIPAATDLSLSHHGNVVAFACEVASEHGSLLPESAS